MKTPIRFIQKNGLWFRDDIKSKKLKLTRKDFAFIDKFCKENFIVEGRGMKTLFAYFIAEYKNGKK